MGVEIERKFLVINDKWHERILSESRIKQGYIANQKHVTVRVRVARDSAWLNIKGATSGIRRAEFEYPVPLEDAESMLQQVVQQPYISKTRYKVKCGNHIWDLDLFDDENRGLVMAEVELEDETEPFEMPEWAGEEVSGDPRYYNASLVKNPYTTW